MRPDALQLDLDAYSGPFDLLCTMLLRRELELQEVALSEIVIGYVERLAEQERVDADTASEFLLLIAALMEIKARELLDVEPELELIDPDAELAQEDMLERLVRYATFRKAARWLDESAPKQRWWRQAARPTRRPHGTYNGPTLDAQLLKKSMGVLLAQPDVDIRHLVGRHASVSEMSQRLLTALHKRHTFVLDDTFEGLNRLDQAVAFVAALELCKNGRIELQQEARFGPIVVSRNAAVSEEDFLGSASAEASNNQSPVVAG